MKKILTYFACAALLLIGGCSSSKVDDAALDRLEAECKKFSEVDSMNYTIGVDMPSSEVKAEIYGSMILDTKEFSLAMDMEAAGQKMEKFMEMYLKDNMMYMSAMGTQQKQEADLSSLDDIGFDTDTMQFDKESLKENLSEASLKEDTIHMVIKDEVLKEQMEDKKDSFSTLGIDEVTQAAIDVECGEDLMQSITVTITGKGNGETQSFKIYVKFADVNQVKNIDYPKDIDSWPMAEEQ